MHFEGAGNDPVVITWIGREHELYSGASPISLVKHRVTFRHDRRLLLLLGFVHNWPTSRWSATKKENRFSLNGNGIMSSFLMRHFYHSTLYLIHLLIGILMYNDLMSRLANDLFFMFISFILLSKPLEFLMCELLIICKRGDNILTKDFGMLGRGGQFHIMHKTLLFSIKCKFLYKQNMIYP